MAVSHPVGGTLASRTRAERLWKEFVRDPSQWWDIRNAKTNPRAPDLQHRLTKESLWMDGSYNPSWVQDMMTLEQPCAMKEQEKLTKTNNSGGGCGWEMLNLEEALASLEKGVPSVEDFTCILHKCRKERNHAYAFRLHACMRKNGLEAHTSLGNYLVSMLVEVGSMCHAQQVFDRLPCRNECSWSSLIAGYIKRGESQQALILYQKMQEDDSVHPSEYTFVALLKACTKVKDIDMGGQIHVQIARSGLLERDVFIASTLVDMYAKCGSLAKAQEVFDKLPVRNVVSWTALIAGYAEHGSGEEALQYFEQMQYEGVPPDAVTFVCSLKACASIGAIDKGQEIHVEITRKGLERDLVVGSTLVDMYAKCGLLAKAHEVFDQLLVRDVVSWTALIAGYAEHGNGEDALNCFKQMQLEGVSLDPATFVCTLKACSSIKATKKGREIHAEIARKGLERDLVVGSTLVVMYAKWGLLAEAEKVFDKLLLQNEVSCNALITGYVEHGFIEKALDCFEEMQCRGISPDAVTFVCSLKACGSIGTTNKGQELHDEIARKGLERNLFICNTLVDMYAKCGLLVEAQEVFNKLLARDEVSWNSLITGYAQLGESENVFYIFDKMIGEGIKPNVVTFGSVLNVCSHTGLLDKGQMYFEAMSKDYGIIPTLEHHTCMADLLSRAGHIDKALLMIKKMPFHPSVVVWHTVLGACQRWSDVELGRQAFEHTVRLDQKDSSAYVCMSNIYADADMQGGFKQHQCNGLAPNARERRYSLVLEAVIG